MKKETKFIYALTLSLFFALPLMAQGIQNGEVINKSQSLRTFRVPTEAIKGSAYIIDEYMPASLSNSEKMYSVKYNAFLDQMEILTDGATKALPMMFNYTIDFVGIKKRYQVFSKEDGTNSFFVVLFKGDKVALLAKENIKFYEEVHPKTGYDKYKPPTLKREKNRYYIGYKNNTTSLLPTKKNDFFSKFGKQAKDVSKYAKSNKLNIKKEEDLIKIFEYYDSL